jgi:serine/threonine protein kinase
MILLPHKIGAFTLHRKLGTGGLAESYVGTHDGGGGTPVVVRRILPFVLRDPGRSASIEARVKDLIGVRHPFLVHVMDHVVVGEDHFIVEEHVDGVSLDGVLNWCRQNGTSIPHNVFLNIATQVCNGLEALHGRSGKGSGAEHVLHLALKPGSVFIGRDGKVVVGSYGLTRSPTTLPHGGVSAPVPARMEYLSPEQTHPDQKLTPASDIFALGATLYELLTTENLFRAESNLQTIHRVRRAEVTTQLLRVKERMPGLDKVLFRALSLNPRHRYQRAFVLREDLRGLMAGYSFATIAEDTRTFLLPLLDSLGAPSPSVAAAPDAPSGSDSFDEAPATRIDPDPMTTAAIAAQALAERVAREREAMQGGDAGVETGGDGHDLTSPGGGDLTNEASVPLLSDPSVPRIEGDRPTQVEPEEDKDRPTTGVNQPPPETEDGIAAVRIPAFDPTRSTPDLDQALGLRALAPAAPTSTAAYLVGTPQAPSPPPEVSEPHPVRPLAGELERPTAASLPPPAAVPPDATSAFADPPPPPAPTEKKGKGTRLSRAMPPPNVASLPPGAARGKVSRSEPTVPVAPAAPAPASVLPPPSSVVAPPGHATLEPMLAEAAPPPPPVGAAPAAAPPAPAAVAPLRPAPRSPPATLVPSPGSAFDEPAPPQRSYAGILFGVAALGAAAMVVCAGGTWLAWNRGGDATIEAPDLAARAPEEVAAAQAAQEAALKAAESTSTASNAASVMADKPPVVQPVQEEPAGAPAVAATSPVPATPAATAAPTPTSTPSPTPAPVAYQPSATTRTAPAASTTRSSSTSSRTASAPAAEPAPRSYASSSRTSAPVEAEPAYPPPPRSTSSGTTASAAPASRSTPPPPSSSRSSRTPPPAPEPRPDVSVTEAPVSALEQYVDNARRGKLSATDVSVLEMTDSADPQYSRSRALLLMNAERRSDDKATRRYLDQLMTVPENQYNPVYLADDARWRVNHGDYDRALERASLAERYWARLPSELVFSKKAEIYEVKAAAWQGKFYKSEQDTEMLNAALRSWEKYREHVASRSRTDLQKRADAEIAKLQDIKERLQ